MLIFISDMLYKYVLVNRESDSLVWIQIQGKCLSKPDDINIGVIYIPPEGSPYANIDDFDILGESLRNKSKNGQVYICGDTNARTSELVDYVITGACDSLSEYIQIQPEGSPRGNVDKTVNGYGKKLIDLCKYTGLQICNGRLNESIYTCYRYNGESVVDYLLAPPGAFASIENFKVCDKTVYSDHSALSFSLTNRTNGLHPVNKDTQQRCSYPVVYRWDPSKQPIYCEKLLDTECTKIYENLLCKIIDIDRDPRSAIGIFDDIF